MATENRRVAAYLPPVIDEQLENYKKEHGIDGDSQAIIQILSQFFGIDFPRSAYRSAPISRVEALEDRMAQVESALVFVESALKRRPQDLGGKRNG